MNYWTNALFSGLILLNGCSLFRYFTDESIDLKPKEILYVDVDGDYKSDLRVVGFDSNHDEKTESVCYFPIMKEDGVEGEISLNLPIFIKDLDKDGYVTRVRMLDTDSKSIRYVEIGEITLDIMRNWYPEVLSTNQCEIKDEIK